MSGKTSLVHKKTSFRALWETIEAIYGDIPDLIKLVLQINGFDSFLALRGIRNEDKNEFFSSLESTIVDIVSSPNETDEKASIVKLVGADCSNFKLKPGHRNLIMNLMLEIDKVDVEEFFSKAHKSPKKEAAPEKIEMTMNETKCLQEMKASPRDTEQLVYEIADHVYQTDENDTLELENEHQEYGQIDDDEEEYILEEYLDQPGTYFKVNSDRELAYELIDSFESKKSSKKRKPDRMYNDEFLSQCLNPRKRRVATKKSYPDNDDGICERFCDMIRQSMECILPQQKLEAVANESIKVSKETDTSWIVVCPLCEANIKLAVVIEYNGRYRNYKRSNFERHLRFKHCKEDKNVTEAIMSIQEY